MVSPMARMFCHSVWKTTRAAIRKTPLKFVHGVLHRVLSDDGVASLGNFVLSLIPCALENERECLQIGTFNVHELV